MTCSSCGRNVDGEVSFCPHCGTRYVAVNSAGTQQRRLVRLPAAGRLGGVCAGIADYLDVDVTFVRLAWIPLAALALQVILSRPMTRSLGYASILPPLLTCIVSLFFGVIGTTLLAAHSRTERHPRLLWSTLVAGMPGALLIVYLVVSLASFLVRG